MSHYDTVNRIISALESPSIARHGGYLILSMYTEIAAATTRGSKDAALAQSAQMSR